LSFLLICGASRQPQKAPTRGRRHSEAGKIKYDGYRLRLERDGSRVRLITP